MSIIAPETQQEAVDSPVVLVDVDDRVMTITLNRPEARNAINREVSTLVGEALDRADQDNNIWAVIITGAGDRAFCAGADLKAVGRGESIVPEHQPHRDWGFAGYTSHAISTPTIAAVNGFALGGGTEIALASDLVVAAEGATFGLPEVKRGIIAGAGGAFRLAQQIPQKVAMEMILTGDSISAQRACELGLVNKVVPESELMAAARELARRITVNAPLAVQGSKRIARAIDDGRISADDEDWERSNSESQALRTTADMAEGVAAFAEKREPRWVAR